MQKLTPSWTVFLLAVILFSATVRSIGQPAEKFWKGNMHSHSYWSDGNTFPEAVGRWYKSQGYHFLVVTEHNRLQQGYKRILHNGTDSVQLRELEDYRYEMEVPGRFLLISGEEISDMIGSLPIHLNGINLSRPLLPAGGASVAECLDQNIRNLKTALAYTGTPEWIILNHPNFGWALTADDLAQSKARFMEVYNGHPTTRNYGDPEHPGTEALWDAANVWRINNKQALLYATATDDAHHYNFFGPGKSNPGRGWVMVKALDLNPVSLYKAMLRGNFYATTGVELQKLTVTNQELRFEILPKYGVNYTIEFIGLLQGETSTKVLKTSSGTKGVYYSTGRELFVRARIISDRFKENPYASGDLEMAWIQPVVFSNKAALLP